MVFFFPDEKDPSYDPTSSPSRKKKKKQEFTAAKREYLLDWLHNAATKVNAFQRKKVTWADALLKKRREAFFDFQQCSIDEAYSRYCKYVWEI